MQNEKTGKVGHAANKAMDAVGGAVGKAGALMTSSADSFAESAAISDRYEIEAGRIAQQRGRTDEVRRAGERMVGDHTDITEKLKLAVHRSMKAEVAELPNELDARRQKMIEHLREAPDDKFDSMYVDQQVAAHEEAVKLMRHFRDEGDCPELRGFAAEVSPIIERHLEQMTSLDQQTG
jgi:putative membrane protein